MDIANLLPWSGLAALITAALLIYRLRPEVRSIDAEAWDSMVETQAKQQEQIAKLHEQLNTMRTDYERRIAMYKSQIASLERRIKELENGKDKG